MTDNNDLKAKFERLKRVKEEQEEKGSADGDFFSGEVKEAAKEKMERSKTRFAEGVTRAKEAATNPENRERAKARVKDIDWKAKLPIFIGLALMVAGYVFMRFPISVVNDMPQASAPVVATPKPKPEPVAKVPSPIPQVVQAVAVAPRAEAVVVSKPQVPSTPTPPAPAQVVRSTPKRDTVKVSAPNQAAPQGVNALYPHSTKLDPNGVNAKYDQTKNNAALDAWASKLKQH